MIKQTEITRTTTFGRTGEQEAGEFDRQVRRLIEDVIDEVMGSDWDLDRLLADVREAWEESERQADSDDQNGVRS